jgi:iron complex transport system substrate-binding protein
MRSSFTRRSGAAAVAGTFVLLLSACGSEESPAAADSAESASVTVVDNHGEVEVPVNPKRVVALDNHVFETLSSWDVDLVAAPKPIMGTLWPKYTEDDGVLDAGAHFEPNLEAVIEADPDLIIGGYRFAEMYPDLKDIQEATIETEPRPQEDHASELKRQTEILGRIFQEEDAAAEIVADFDAAVEKAKSAYNGEEAVIGLITTGGEISYAAPVEGRGVGAVFPTLGLRPAIDQEAEDTIHGDDISLEAIAQAAPDWLIVLDIDGAFQEDGYVAAEGLIGEAEALQNVPAVQKGQVVYLDPNFYLDESIQAYTRLYEDIAEAFGAAS